MRELCFFALIIATAIATNAVEHNDKAEHNETVLLELSPEETQVLLEAPGLVLNSPPSLHLRQAIRIGSVEQTKVEKTVTPLSEQDAKRFGSSLNISIVGWIHYTPIKLSPTRLFKPVVLCAPYGNEIHWNFCQDESWIRLQTPTMKKAIRFNGDLTDADIDKIFELVDDAGIVSKAGSVPITADAIGQVIKYRNECS